MIIAQRLYVQMPSYTEDDTVGAVKSFDKGLVMLYGAKNRWDILQSTVNDLISFTA
jgi:hypothetical protein